VYYCFLGDDPLACRDLHHLVLVVNMGYDACAGAELRVRQINAVAVRQANQELQSHLSCRVVGHRQVRLGVCSAVHVALRKRLALDILGPTSYTSNLPVYSWSERMILRTVLDLVNYFMQHEHWLLVASGSFGPQQYWHLEHPPTGLVFSIVGQPGDPVDPVALTTALGVALRAKGP
jgi:hypothetical protein